MLRYLPKKLFPEYLTCPFCFATRGTTLKITNKGVYCQKCKRVYLVRKNILQFVSPKELDKETQRELHGNSYIFTKEDINHYANKDKWSKYYNHFSNQKFTHLVAFLKAIDFDGIVSLGSGTGFELKEILKRKKVNLVFSSDLAFAPTSVVPITLSGRDIKLCLFTSDLNRVPLRPNPRLPVLIYEALHHTENIHSTIEKLLRRRYKNILFVEPTTNFVIKFLALFGLAQRVEYSGLKPEFLDIGILKKLARKHKYNLKIRTLWHIPEDYFRFICKKGSKLESPLLKLIDLFSQLGSIFQFGSFSVVSLEFEG